MEFRFERHFIDVIGFFIPNTNEIWVNGKYSAKKIERLIEGILTHETIHAVIFDIEGYFSSQDFDRSKAVELKECWGIDL